MWQNHSFQLFSVHGVSDLRQTEIHRAQPIVFKEWKDRLTLVPRGNATGHMIKPGVFSLRRILPPSIIKTNTKNSARRLATEPQGKGHGNDFQ